jgi:adenosylcobinamide-GDP ribazoletransferase
MMHETQDVDPSSKESSPVGSFLAAVQFLTLSPAMVRRAFTPGELGRAVGFYPLVGALIGAILFGWSLPLDLIFPPQVSAALILGLWVLLSGALHLDGFLDACDGLLGGRDATSRLEIMRDERVGAFGLAGGVLLLLTKYAVLVSLPGRAGALLAGPIAGRWVMALAVVWFPYARPQGLGRAIKDNAGRREVLLATAIALPAAWLAGGWLALAAAGLAALAAWAAGWWVTTRIPGLTGDVYGALNELGELVVLLVFSAAGVLL